VDTLYIFNPKSNGGKSASSWKKLVSKYDFLPDQPIDITSVSDLSSLISSNSPELVVAMGGDGTVNAVASSIMNLEHKPTIAVVPLGFGNALSYSLGVEDIDRAIDVIQKRPRKVVIDIVKTNIPSHDYGLFAVSVGFDAQVVLDKDNKFLRRINPYSYILSALSVSLKHRPKPLEIVIDDKFEIETMAASLLVANWPTIGKNILVSENARYNDGFLNCTIFLSKSSYVKNMRYKGIKHPLYSRSGGKILFKAKKLKITGERYVQVDGDATTMNGPIELSVAPNKLKFLSA